LKGGSVGDGEGWGFVGYSVDLFALGVDEDDVIEAISEDHGVVDVVWE